MTRSILGSGMERPRRCLPLGGTDAISLLIVDDNHTFLGAAIRFLQEEGIHVEAALSAEEGLACAQTMRPQVILLDLAMPRLSGLEVIPLLRKALPEAGIIVLTLLDSNGYRESALAAGADAFVSKATLATDLLPTIQRVVEVRTQREILGGGPPDGNVGLISTSEGRPQGGA